MKPIGFTILVDTREQAPFTFENPKYSESGLLGVEKHVLNIGDYTLKENPIKVIERKSLQDFYGSLIQGRDRFEEEMQRAKAKHIEMSIVIEGYFEQILKQEYIGNAKPLVLINTIDYWTHRYNISFFFAGTYAEWLCFSLLKSAYCNWMEKRKFTCLGGKK